MVVRDTYLEILLSVENKSTQSGNKNGSGRSPDHNILVKKFNRSNWANVSLFCWITFYKLLISYLV